MQSPERFPGISRKPGIVGGDPCIAGTRIPVWLLVEARQLGMSEKEILRAYPSLNTGELTQAWSYYDSHRDEIQRQIQDNEAA